MAFKLGITIDVCMAYVLMLVSINDFDLDARSLWVGKGKTSVLL